MHGPGESSQDSGGWRSAISAARSVGRGSARAGNGAKRAMRRLTRAGGAGRTGLANLIELTAASSMGDAFVAVALAGTLFFSASVDQARGRVALALLITIAPFAVLAPFIGPVLDRVQQGRRFILAGTLLARGLLCWGMAGAVSHNDALTLLPAAFGVLVLQKAFGVTRSAIAPRLLPAEITLVTANARSSLASLIATTAGAALAAGLGALLGGGQTGAGWVLRIGTFIYLAAMVLAFRLPDGVDTPLSEQVTVAFKRGPEGPEPVPAGPAPEPGGQLPFGEEDGGPGGTQPLRKPRSRWRFPALGPAVAEAMGANAALRAFSGFMIFFLAFLLRTVHFGSVPDKVALGEMIGAAALGGFLGTAIGAGLKSRAPQVLVFGMLGLATVVCIGCALFFGLWAALVVAAMAALGQALVKLALDSILQRETGEEIRSSTFAASETLHQLSWVAGGLAGLAMSLTSSGVAGLAVAAAGLAAALLTLLVRRRHRIVEGRRAPSRVAV
jgi:MFS family permease